MTAPLGSLLATDGDRRLAIAPDDGLNCYGCRASPRPEAIAFSSSTATSISERAFQRTAQARDALIQESLALGPEGAFIRAAARLRQDLLRLLALDGTGAEAIFSPSGTDAQVHAVAIARALLDAPLTSIVVGCDETGSGSALSAHGRHFSERTAHGVAVVKGATISGLEGIRRVGVPFHGPDGRRRSDEEMDAAVRQAVAGAIGRGDKVILFTMDSSKLGRRSPGDGCLRAIRARWPEAVQVAVDACQFRLGRRRIGALVALGCMVLLTGSKFFTGPPFSGALLVPPDAARRLTKAVLPAGLRAYTSAADWPECWPVPRRAFPLRISLGQWLRWVAALEEMRAYYAAPTAFRTAALERFAARVPQILMEGGGAIEPLSGTAVGHASDDEFASRTIVPFAIRRCGHGLSPERCAALYAALNRDVAHLLPAGATARQRRIAARPCHIGQPVLTPERGDAVAVLRINAGARLVSESWMPDRNVAMAHVDRELDGVATVVAKIELLLDYV